MTFTDKVRAMGEFCRLLWLQAKERVMARRVQVRQAQFERLRQKQVATAQAYDAVRAENKSRV